MFDRTVCAKQFSPRHERHQIPRTRESPSEYLRGAPRRPAPPPPSRVIRALPPRGTLHARTGAEDTRQAAARRRVGRVSPGGGFRGASSAASQRPLAATTAPVEGDGVNTSPPVSDRVAKTTSYMRACRCGSDVHLQDGAIRYIAGN